MKEFIKIGGLNYRVSQVENLARDNGALGRCCGNSRTIEIDSNLDEQVKEKTLIHEIIEAINFENQLNLEHWKISVLESSIYQILKDNGGIIDV